MEIDFSSMLAAITVADIIGAMLALGFICTSSNFTMWAVDKVAGFFGYDPYDRENKLN